MKPRERQSVWCCGSNYQRWRFFGDAFPVKPRSHYKHHTHCCHCGKELVWPETRLRAMKPDEKVKHRRQIVLRSQRKLVARRAEQGLTSLGHKPLRRAPVLNEVERAWRSERAAMGDDRGRGSVAIGAGLEKELSGANTQHPTSNTQHNEL